MCFKQPYAFHSSRDILQYYWHSIPGFLMSGWWWWQLSVSLRWPMMSELSGRLWPTDSDSDGPMVGSKLSRAASHSAEAGAGVFVNRLRRVGSRCRGWERSEEIDKSKTLITTGYSASPVNMGLIWGRHGPSIGIIGSPQTKTCTKQGKSPLSFVLKNCYQRIVLAT